MSNREQFTKIHKRIRKLNKMYEHIVKEGKYQQSDTESANTFLEELDKILSKAGATKESRTKWSYTDADKLVKKAGGGFDSKGNISTFTMYMMGIIQTHFTHSESKKTISLEGATFTFNP